MRYSTKFLTTKTLVDIFKKGYDKSKFVTNSHNKCRSKNPS